MTIVTLGPLGELFRKKPLKFATENRGDQHDALLCPRCGGTYLHHGKVTVFCRTAYEDGDTQVFAVDPDTTVSKEIGKASNNPSSRRHGLAIAVWCENCPFLGELTIAQHKGETHIEWRQTGEALSP